MVLGNLPHRQEPPSAVEETSRVNQAERTFAVSPTRQTGHELLMPDNRSRTHREDGVTALLIGELLAEGE